MELKRRIFILIIIFLLLSIYRGSVSAAGGSISVSPDSGSHSVGQIFTVSIVIEGGGQEFNAAKATLKVSPALYTQNLTIGDCGFAFVKVPTKTDPSFAGVILGGSVKNCSLYTLELKAVRPETGVITFSDASIKSYKGASEILSSIKNGSYSINQTSSAININTLSEPNPTTPPIMNSQQIRLYNIVYNASLPKNVSASKVLVTLDPALPSAITVSPALKPGIPKTITVTFQNVTEGIHTVNTTLNNKILSSQVINVSGDNRNLEFGVSTKPTLPVWIWYALSVIILALAGILGVLVFRLYRRRSNKQTRSPQ